MPPVKRLFQNLGRFGIGGDSRIRLNLKGVGAGINVTAQTSARVIGKDDRLRRAGMRLHRNAAYQQPQPDARCTRQRRASGAFVKLFNWPATPSYYVASRVLVKPKIRHATRLQLTGNTTVTHERTVPCYRLAAAFALGALPRCAGAPPRACPVTAAVGVPCVRAGSSRCCHQTMIGLAIAMDE